MGEGELEARRPPAAAVRFGEFRLDPIRAEFTRSGQPVALRPKTFSLLALFVASPRRLLGPVAAWYIGNILIGAPPPREFASNYRYRTYAAMERELKPVEGIEQALDRIAIPYCVASNGPHEKMRKTLGITSLLPRFEGRMFSSADVARGKPFPDLFLHAASHFAVPPSACLVIEDSASGVEAARAAGMSVYGFSANEAEVEEKLLAAGARKVFHHMRELPGLAAGAR